MATLAIVRQAKRETDSHVVRKAFKDLARAIVIRAIKDALGRDVTRVPESEKARLASDARAWLSSPDGVLFAELAGCDTALINRWTAAGCPTKPNSHLNHYPAG